VTFNNLKMKLNSIIFPAPRSSYTASQLLGEVLYVPKSSFLERHKNAMQQRLIESASRQNASYFGWGQGQQEIPSYGKATHIPCLFF
jgi:hypothetical protein